MLKCTGNFKNGINGVSREVKCKIAYLSLGDEIKFLEGKDIQSINYTSQGKKELGCIVKKVVEGTLIYNDKTSELKKEAFINLIYVCDGECKVDIFYVSELKVKHNKQSIIFQAVDMITYLTMNPKNIGIPLVKETNLKSYMSIFFKALGFDEQEIGNIANPNLMLGYPKSTNVSTTLEEMAIAGNALVSLRCLDTTGGYLPFYLPKTLDDLIISNSVKAVARPYQFGEPCTSVSSYVSYAIEDESTDQYNDVKVCIFFPRNTEQKNLGTMKTIVPASTNNYSIGKLTFENTCIPQVCKFNDKVKVESYSLGSDSCSFTLTNFGVLTQTIEAEFYGIDITESTTLDTSTDNDNNIKVINNLYIQGACVYDVRIYENKNIDINYFGNPLIEVGDTIEIDGLIVLVKEHVLRYSGGLRGSIKGVLLDEQPI